VRGLFRLGAEAMPGRPDGGLHAIRDAEFADDVFDLRLDGAFSDEEDGAE